MTMKKLPSHSDNDAQKRQQLIKDIVLKAPHFADIDLSEFSTDGLTIIKQTIDERLTETEKKTNDSFFA
jgi:hypothetical protein